MSPVDQIAIERMAGALAASKCNLDDERSVMRALLAAGTNQGDVLALSDAAVARAKKFSTQGANR